MARKVSASCDKQRVAKHTWNWWRMAHAEKSQHHQRFSGYCPWCKPDRTPEWLIEYRTLNAAS